MTTFTNNGFIIIADTELNDRFNYRSSDASTSSQRPKLVIQYTTSTPTPGPSPTPTNTPSGPTQTPTWTPTPSQTPTVVPTTPSPTFQNASFVYDGDGKRVKSTINGTTTTYFAGTHFELTGSTVTKYYYAGTQRIAMRSGTWEFSNPVTGTLKFILGDHLGSTSLTTDAAGDIVSEIRYKAWGTVRYATENVPTKYQYTGQYSYEAEFGLYFYNARWYDPVLSRFAQADTIIPSYQGVQAWDRYTYTNNNPLRYTDPSGHGVDCGIGMGCVTPSTNSGSQTDITEWLANELNTQLKSPDLENPIDDCVIESLECVYAKMGALHGSHLNLFTNYGKYDIKRNMEEISNPHGAIVLCGQEGCMWVDYSTPGNIMFGYLSAARGVDQPVSWVAGGALEVWDWVTEGRDNGLPYTGERSSWFDNPGDKAAVDFGYSLYEKYPNGFTLSEFQASLTAETLSTFQVPKDIPSVAPVSQPNLYPPGYFLNPK